MDILNWLTNCLFCCYELLFIVFIFVLAKNITIIYLTDLFAGHSIEYSIVVIVSQERLGTEILRSVPN